MITIKKQLIIVIVLSIFSTGLSNVEQIDNRTFFSKTYSLGSGKYRVEYFTKPIHYMDDFGNYVSIPPNDSLNYNLALEQVDEWDSNHNGSYKKIITSSNVSYDNQDYFNLIGNNTFYDDGAETVIWRNYAVFYNSSIQGAIENDGNIIFEGAQVEFQYPTMVLPYNEESFGEININAGLLDEWSSFPNPWPTQADWNDFINIGTELESFDPGQYVVPDDFLWEYNTSSILLNYIENIVNGSSNGDLVFTVKKQLENFSSNEDYYIDMGEIKLSLFYTINSVILTNVDAETGANLGGDLSLYDSNNERTIVESGDPNGINVFEGGYYSARTHHFTLSGKRHINWNNSDNYFLLMYNFQMSPTILSSGIKAYFRHQYPIINEGEDFKLLDPWYIENPYITDPEGWHQPQEFIPYSELATDGIYNVFLNHNNLFIIENGIYQIKAYKNLFVSSTHVKSFQKWTGNDIMFNYLGATETQSRTTDIVFLNTLSEVTPEYYSVTTDNNLVGLSLSEDGNNIIININNEIEATESDINLQIPSLYQPANASLVQLSQNTYKLTNITGDVEIGIESMSLNQAGIPLIIDASTNIVFPPGGTYLCAPEFGIEVRDVSHFQLSGTHDHPITFKNLNPITDPGFGDEWKGISFESNMDVHLSYIHFIGANEPLRIGFSSPSWEGTTIIEHCVFLNNNYIIDQNVNENILSDSHTGFRFFNNTVIGRSDPSTYFNLNMPFPYLFNNIFFNMDFNVKIYEGEQISLHILNNDFINCTFDENSSVPQWEYNMQEDPLFVGYESNNFNLNSQSPCIDVGMSLLNIPWMAHIELPSEMDPDSTIPDLGAFYFDKVPDAPLGFTILGDVGDHPELTWDEHSESDVLEYQIYRSLNYGDFLLTATVNNTNWVDTEVTINNEKKFSNRACYTLKAVDAITQVSPSTTPNCESVDIGLKKQAFTLIPKEYEWTSTYPNPFNPTTTIQYGLPEVSHITFTIHNMLGQLIKTIESKNTPAGYHSIQWNSLNDAGEKVPSGMYIVKMNATSINGNKSFTQSQKIVLLK